MPIEVAPGKRFSNPLFHLVFLTNRQETEKGFIENRLSFLRLQRRGKAAMIFKICKIAKGGHGRRSGRVVQEAFRSQCAGGLGRLLRIFLSKRIDREAIGMAGVYDRVLSTRALQCQSVQDVLCLTVRYIDLNRLKPEQRHLKGSSS